MIIFNGAFTKPESGVPVTLVAACVLSGAVPDLTFSLHGLRWLWDALTDLELHFG